MIKVAIYNEFLHERSHEEVRAIYPDGIHMCIKQFLDAEDDIEVVNTFTLDNVDTLTRDVLDGVDVLIWWGHMAHEKVPDSVAADVQNAVLRGLGLIVLHSGHMSKPFRLLMGTTCTLTWREGGDSERVWVVKPAHPIAKGLGRFLYLDRVETYGEPFDVPEPDETVFVGGYSAGEVFRSGLCYRRGNGKVFYFQPGHETCPIYHHPGVQTVIKNAVRWAKSDYRVSDIPCPWVPAPGIEG